MPLEFQVEFINAFRLIEKATIGASKVRNLTKLILILTYSAVLSVSCFLFVFGTTHVSLFPEKEYPQVYIRSDGNIETRGIRLSDVPISREGEVYILTADMELQNFIAEKSNMVLDGNGFSIEIVGPGGYKTDFNLGHFDFTNVENVTIRNLSVTSSELTFEGSSSCKVVNSSGVSFVIKNSQDILVSENDPGRVLLVDSTN
jgi:hypothetical protein